MLQFGFVSVFSRILILSKKQKKAEKKRDGEEENRKILAVEESFCSN